VQLERREGRLVITGRLWLGSVFWVPLVAIPMFHLVGVSWLEATAFVAAAETMAYLVCWGTASIWAAELLRQIEGPNHESAGVAT
jgi:hypothetical protein